MIGPGSRPAGTGLGARGAERRPLAQLRLQEANSPQPPFHLIQYLLQRLGQRGPRPATPHPITIASGSTTARRRARPNALTLLSPPGLHISPSRRSTSPLGLGHPPLRNERLTSPMASSRSPGCRVSGAHRGRGWRPMWRAVAVAVQSQPSLRIAPPSGPQRNEHTSHPRAAPCHLTQERRLGVVSTDTAFPAHELRPVEPFQPDHPAGHEEMERWSAEASPDRQPQWRNFSNRLRFPARIPGCPRNAGTRLVPRPGRGSQIGQYLALCV
jgi:hypothetical protein